MKLQTASYFSEFVQELITKNLECNGKVVQPVAFNLPHLLINMETFNYTGFYNYEINFNVTTVVETKTSDQFDVMMILQMLISSVGIVANWAVVFAFPES